MSNKAWRMDEEDKIKVGKYIIDTIMADGEFPKTAEEGKQVLNSIIGDKDESFFEGEVSGVLFLENDANGIMHIAVPPRQAVKDRYYNVGEYEVPETYKNIVNGNSKLSKEETYQFRIGDYTISHCG